MFRVGEFYSFAKASQASLQVGELGFVQASFSLPEFLHFILSGWDHSSAQLPMYLGPSNSLVGSSIESRSQEPRGGKLSSLDFCWAIHSGEAWAWRHVSLLAGSPAGSLPLTGS